MEMIANPVFNNNRKRISVDLQSNKNNTVEGSSGLTLGLILKEYCEFNVINSYNSILIL